MCRIWGPCCARRRRWRSRASSCRNGAPRGSRPLSSTHRQAAVEHLNIALVTNLVQALVRLKKSGVWIVGLDAAPSAVPLPRADLSGSLALVVGAEGAGSQQATRETCDWLLAIPMCGEIASLNAAVAVPSRCLPLGRRGAGRGSVWAARRSEPGVRRLACRYELRGVSRLYERRPDVSRAKFLPRRSTTIMVGRSRCTSLKIHPRRSYSPVTVR